MDFRVWLDQVADHVKTNGIDCIAVDGHCGSGKSTLGSLLAHAVDGDLVHMDDFYLPFVLRPSMEDFPGNHMDYGRLQKEVIDSFRKDHTFIYRPYNAHKDTYGQTTVCNKKILIIEGSYALHPLLNYGSTIYRLFMTIDPMIQKSRIIARGGSQCWQGFQTRWIPAEHRYFDTYSIAQKCDQIIEYDDSTIKIHKL